MILIEPKQFKSFEEYIDSLAPSAKKNLKTAFKRNSHRVYKQVVFNEQKVNCFMQLWERQYVRGNPIKWGFTIDWVKKKNSQSAMLFFETEDAMQFIEKRPGYYHCHPIMYDKSNSESYIAKYMWFRLIEWSIHNETLPLDLGGGPNNWVQCIKNRDSYPNTRYKWLYIPESVKKNPLAQPQYMISRKSKKLRVATSNRYLDYLLEKFF